MEVAGWKDNRKQRKRRVNSGEWGYLSHPDRPRSMGRGGRVKRVFSACSHSLARSSRCCWLRGADKQK
eukprot:671241-Hanusia_phi.AAC.1